MKKLFQIGIQIKTFFNEVLAELRKASWPTRNELLNSTLVVIFSVIALAIFVGASDLVLIQLLKLIL